MNKEKQQLVIDFIESEFPRRFSVKTCFSEHKNVLEKWLSIINHAYSELQTLTIPISSTTMEKITDQELTYIPKTQYNDLVSQAYTCIQYTFVIKHSVLRHFHIHIYFPLGKKVSTSQLQMVVTKIFLWFSFVSRFSSTHCSKRMNIHLFMVDNNKELPDRFSPLGPYHVNSAFTTSCKPETSMYIYREEEWFKVMMHESFHNMGLDFSHVDELYGNKALLAVFPNIKAKSIRIYESYCETWATFFQCFFKAFLTTQKKTNTNLICKKTKQLLEKECVYSMLQSTRILNYYGFTYHSFIDVIQQGKMVEHTNVFSYYIIKSILLCHFDSFWTWCKRNNKNILQFTNDLKTIDSYIELIIMLYNKPDFLKMIDKTQEVMDKYNKQNKSLRMTLYG